MDASSAPETRPTHRSSTGGERPFPSIGPKWLVLMPWRYAITSDIDCKEQISGVGCGVSELSAGEGGSLVMTEGHDTPGGPLAAKLFALPEPQGWKDDVETELKEIEEAEAEGAERLKDGRFIRS